MFGVRPGSLSSVLAGEISVGHGRALEAFRPQHLNATVTFLKFKKCEPINSRNTFSPIAMLWGLAKLIGGRAPSGHRQSWWADGVPVMF